MAYDSVDLAPKANNANWNERVRIKQLSKLLGYEEEEEEEDGDHL